MPSPPHPRALYNVPLYQSVVFWDGDLGLYCIDYDHMVQLPNIAEQGFLKAYLSDEATRARKRGFLKQFAICQGCSYSNAENMGIKIKFRKQQASAAQPRCAATGAVGRRPASSSQGAVALFAGWNFDLTPRGAGRYRRLVTVPNPQKHVGGMTMKWHTPKIVEICVALEINDYVPAEL